MIIFVLIILISFVAALFSMGDLQMPEEISRFISRKKIRGSIIILKDKIKHYSS